ncbi:methyltransferase domain-containing protein [Helicobacter saguini]|uniref:Methyltransferase domain-containing protein n=1 Tax=Helicobacter saguini TaxID=1548018 RepID=A0A347VPD7_9HELI|nr:class I SAM-dependent methyltransferase [Helicobacter saguini]MWV61407.1 methyltransferase domain-containing protein [Helicobacter saguini]MWV67925.1 methyltransferase domain-containing protein [Helicobacter saguini]MWV70608.1 methyltransferase domain-containing protein [Helicobacter saguini]MWV72512.1 methyltransferase domain-containing protein [Helicobacter saguini]TLD94745.1 methyltransferase domain-containing protein [Helicobacter saguini]
MKNLVEQKWDYTKHAKFYEYRPNYANGTIDMLTALVKGSLSRDSKQNIESLKVADIGAGSGNLSIMLLERGLDVVAVEPNDAMREIGIERTKGQKIEWVRATGLDSTLGSEEFEWVTFGSSFGVMDRNEALRETHRLLKKGGYFSCLWNHRDLNDKLQNLAEECIFKFVPNYTRGVRREDQREILEKNKNLFDCIVYSEEDFYFHQNIENYIKAWKSVKNPYWDLATSEGVKLFDTITNEMAKVLPSEFDIKYTTRTWSARKV